MTSDTASPRNQWFEFPRTGSRLVIVRELGP